MSSRIRLTTTCVPSKRRCAHHGHKHLKNKATWWELFFIVVSTSLSVLISPSTKFVVSAFRIQLHPQLVRRQYPNYSNQQRRTQKLRDQIKVARGFECTSETRRKRVRTIVYMSLSNKVQEAREDNESIRDRRLQLTIYNSKTRRKEVFVPQQLCTKRNIDGEINELENQKTIQISMYTCGPTVYDMAHVGNFRAFLTYDLLKRVLMYLGYACIVHVCNITDVDDKIINKANKLQIPIGEIQTLTSMYEDAFLNDLRRLNCIPATYYPRATEHIQDMITLIQELAGLGLAYETSDGSWYYNTQHNSVTKSRYGRQLVQLNYDDMIEQKEAFTADKKHFADFCLWKAYKDGIDRIDSSWESSEYCNNHNDDSYDCCHNNDNMSFPPARQAIRIRRGRPGWHIECSAMARHFFGTATLDFHGGGQDLKFPHHENEIAQSEAVYNPRWYYPTAATASSTTTTTRTSTSSSSDTVSTAIRMAHQYVSTEASEPRTEDCKEEDEGSSSLATLTSLPPFVEYCNCWFHNGFVNIGASNEKMSKSKQNFLTLNDACPTPLDVRAYRYLVVTSHYRNPLTYTPDVMEASKNTIIRLDKIKAAMEDVLVLQQQQQQHQHQHQQSNHNNSSELAAVIVPDAITKFETAILDDLMTPRASAAMFTVIKAAEKEMKRYNASINADNGANQVDVIGIKAALDALKQMDQVFGIFYNVPSSSEMKNFDQISSDDSGTSTSGNDTIGTDDVENNRIIPERVLELVQERNAAKDSKDYTLADSIRTQILELGYAVKDVKNGEPIITRSTA